MEETVTNSSTQTQQSGPATNTASQPMPPQEKKEEVSKESSEDMERMARVLAEFFKSIAKTIGVLILLAGLVVLYFSF